MIHPQSYVHSIIRFKNGLIKMILYNTDMKIPISNTLYGKKNHVLSVKKIDAKILNKLSFQNVDIKRFPYCSYLIEISILLGHNFLTTLCFYLKSNQYQTNHLRVRLF